MNLFITDSLSFSKKNKEWLFSANEINKYKITFNEFNELGFKRPKKIEKVVIAIVEENNYRLIFDLINSYTEVRFYSLVDKENPFKYRYTPDIDFITSQFDNFMKRGYISYLQSSELKSNGLNRIENLIVASAFYKKNISKEVTNVSIIKNKPLKTNNYLSLYRFIIACSIHYEYSIGSTVEYIHKLYFRGGCSNPYDKKGIMIYEDDDFFLPVYNELINLSIHSSIYKVYFKDRFINVVQIDGENQIINTYFNATSIKYSKGMIFNYPNLNFNILNNLIKILPLKDTLLNIQLMERKNHLEYKEDGSMTLSKSIKSKLGKTNISMFSNLNYWNKIYNSMDYSFELEEIFKSDTKFICPVCKDNKFRMTPITLMCSNKECSFKFLRTNLSNNLFIKNRISQISLDDILNSLKNSSQLLRSDSGNYFLVFTTNDKNVYKLWVKNPNN